MLRIAAIEFLNAAPLMWGLQADSRFQMQHTLPSVCADQLRAGAADLGVIPAIELARIPGLAGLGGMGVAAQDGEGEAAEVRSILLLCRLPAAQVKTVALDRASRTSAALAQVLLKHHFGACCTAVPGDRDWCASLQHADAALLIGDPALQLRVHGDPRAAGLEIHDLARVWREWTGLPFVFALWGVRAPVWAAEGHWLGPRLAQALDQGWAHRDDLVDTWAPRLGLPPREVRRYLQQNVAYRITPAHEAALHRFCDLAAADGLIAPASLPPLIEAVRGMIAYLNGIVRERHPARLVLDVHGVGYELQVPARTFQSLPAVGAAAAVFVHTHVREDALQLFGFAAAAERELFERLIAVNGVGPKMGLAILSVFSPEDLARAVQTNDFARLTTIPGVGKKTAERLVIELRDKLPAAAPDAAAAAAPLTGPAEDVLSALVNLGYAQPQAAQAVQRALQKLPTSTFDQLFTACMKSL